MGDQRRNTEIWEKKASARRLDVGASPPSRCPKSEKRREGRERAISNPARREKEKTPPR